MRIDHPSVHNPVSFWRWLKYRLGVPLHRVGWTIEMTGWRLKEFGHHLQWRAIDPDDEIPF